MKNLVRAIKHMLVDLELNQQTLAEHLDVSTLTVSKLLNEKSSLDTLLRLYKFCLNNYPEAAGYVVDVLVRQYQVLPIPAHASEQAIQTAYHTLMSFDSFTAQQQRVTEALAQPEEPVEVQAGTPSDA